MKRPSIVVGLLGLAFFVAACGTSTSPTSPLNRTQLKAAGLRMIATVSGPSGGAVTFGIGLENGTATPLTLVFSSGQFFDIEVADRSGDVVWRWSHDKGFTTAFWDLELQAGESYVRNATWDLKDNNGRSVPSGTYGCRLWITNYPRDEALVSETTLTI
jgi:Intracellular proteinase inhibitor